MIRVVCSDGSWVRCWVWISGSVYHGSGGGVGLDRLWLVGLDRGNWWVSQRRLVGFWVWIGAMSVDRCCGFGSVLLWPVLEVEGEIEEKEEKKRNSKKRNKIECLNKMRKK